MVDVSLMALPSRADDPESSATFYLLRHGSWREVPAASSPLIGLGTLRKAVEDLLDGVMTRVANGQPGGARAFMQAKSQEWWTRLVPDVLKQALIDARRSAEATGEVPRLLVNALPNLEWLPWELLYDGTDYLGLRFQVARLPIVPHGAEPPDGPRHVARAVNFLGSRVLTETELDAYQSWAGTFDPFQSLGVTGRRWPADGLDSGRWPTLDDLMEQGTADIIHITAHGGVDDDGRQFLMLDYDDPLTNSIDESIANVLPFSSPGPLVFGNACGSVSAGGTPLTRGLGVSFFDRGAAAYIGSMAPLSTHTAISFAAQFYRYLLEDGLCVGEALRQAKVAQNQLGQSDPSHLFYCLYGLPETRFLPHGPVDVVDQPAAGQPTAPGGG